MRAEALALLDAHWATHLGCPIEHVRSNQTILIPHPQRTGGSVWLIGGRTCVIAASTQIISVLKTSVGTRAPMQAFDPARLKAAILHLGVSVQGPEAILALDRASENLTWLEANQLTNLNGFNGLGLIALPLKQHADRKAAEAQGFELYASVIDLGERVRP
jgi:hypothetical protein